MIVTFLIHLGWFALLVLCQALLFNNIHIFGCATPFIYLYLIIKFNADTSRYALLLWGFALGLTVDIFENTPGINASATLLLAMTRPGLLRLFTPRDSADNFTPGISSMGSGLFIRYTLLSLLVHQTAFITLLTFSFTDPLTMLVRIISNTLLTILCFWGIEKVRT